MRNSVIFTSTLLVLSAMFSSVIADVPRQMSYQGRLTDFGGVPVDTTVDLTIVIFEDEAGTTPLWGETHPDVSIADGLFDLILGSINPIPDSAFDGQVRWLGVQIESSPINDPLSPIVSIAYAIMSAYADTAAYALAAAGGGGGWSDDGTVVRLTTIDDSVGVGTDAPQAKLHVEGGLYVSEKVTIGPGNSNSGNMAFVAGENNSVTGGYSTIGGGAYSSVEGTYATIAGGGPSDPGNPTISQNMVFDNYGTIGGGGGNRAGADDAAIDNQIFATVSGGKDNSALSTFSTIGGGTTNTATGYGSTIGGGEANSASNNYTGVASGYGNESSGTASSVGGGQSNIAAGNYTRVSGGKTNFAEGQYSVIGGGMGNVTDGSLAAITGGLQNIVSGNYSAILGGSNNTIEVTAPYSYLFGINSNLTEDSTFMVDMPHIRFGDEVGGYEFPSGDGSNGQIMVTDGSGQMNWSAPGAVGNWTVEDSILYTTGYWGLSRGGVGNVFIGDSAHTMVNLGAACTTGSETWISQAVTVGGGYGNHAHGTGAIVAGGRLNQAVKFSSTVSGGYANKASGESSFIGGGSHNTADNVQTIVCGGSNNHADDYLCFIGGGWADTAQGWGSTIGGGHINRTRSKYCGVFSGQDNIAGNEYADSCSFVGGGQSNAALAVFSTVGGGVNDTASGDYSVVCGGDANTANSGHSFVGGGQGNLAGWDGAAVAGGEWNEAIGGVSFIGGGVSNRAAGDYSAVLGGLDNYIMASGDYSYLFGLHSVLSQDSTFMVDMPHIRFGTEADGYEFPSQDGTSGQIMVTDGSGALSWTSSILAKTDQTDEMKAEIESLKELVGKLVERIETLEYQQGDAEVGSR